jgi:hypothetical protein
MLTFATLFHGTGQKYMDTPSYMYQPTEYLQPKLKMPGTVWMATGQVPSGAHLATFTQVAHSSSPMLKNLGPNRYIFHAKFFARFLTYFFFQHLDYQCNKTT